jgi:hypothetical protein
MGIVSAPCQCIKTEAGAGLHRGSSAAPTFWRLPCPRSAVPPSPLPDLPCVPGPLLSLWLGLPSPSCLPTPDWVPPPALPP